MMPKRDSMQDTEILIVEDSPTQRQRLALILENAGYRVTAAASGEEALARIAARRPTLVVSDVIMPGMNGYDLCRRIKDNPDLADLPVILVTYLSETHDVVRGVEAGSDNFVMKPYEPDFLLSRIARTLAGAHPTRPCARSEFPVDINGESFCIRSDCRQVLEILLSTYEMALQKNERLKAAREELQFANQELEAFSYSVSHDLRGPLSVIAGFTELLWLDNRDRLDEASREHLQMIRRSVEKMEGLIEDLLKLSRITRAELQAETVDLSAMLAAIAAELRATEPDRKVEMIFQEGMTITGDPALLRIAFENLLRNAWKFTSKKEDARIEAGWTPGPKPVYHVRDNGAGFDMQDAEKLFATFQRLHSNEEFPGTGLGLAIVHRIIARHGGRVWAEGSPGEGATFYLTVKS